MPIKVLYAICIVLNAMMLFRCHGGGKETSEDGFAGVPQVVLSAAELSEAGIKTDSLTRITLDQFVECSGILEIPHSRRVNIASPLSGIFRSSPVLSDQFVLKGSVIATLESIEYLTIQQEYLESKSRLAYYREELKRQGELTIENASSVKKLQRASLDYQENEIRLAAMDARLKLLGMEPDSLTVENISPLYEIRAPVSAFVKRFYAVTGEFISPGPLIEMVTSKQPLLVLSLSESNLPLLRKGQNISYLLASDTTEEYRAKLVTFSGTIDPLTHTVHVEAIPVNPPKLLPGMSVRAKIGCDSITVRCIKSSAIVSDKSGDFVYVKNGLIFVKVPVRTGLIRESYTEIRDMEDWQYHDSIVVDGTGYLIGQSHESGR